VAGVFSSFVSQPADTVLSRMNEKKDGSFFETGQVIVEESGVPGLWAGFGPRCVWAGSIISGQFLLYDVFRDLLDVTPADLTEYLDPLRDTFEGVVAASP
jgi:solute carrier family 25 phosphate transporter 3